MRMGCAVGAIVIATAACGSSSAAPTAPAPAHPTSGQCGPRSAKTLAADGQARVYSAGGKVYGCANATARSYLLAANQSRPGQPRLEKVAVAGVDAAYGEITFGVDTGSATVTVRRLDNGRTLRSLAAMTQPVGPESFQSIDSLVVKEDGAVAWIAAATSIIRHSGQIEVDRADRRGRATLDTSHGIGSSSLSLRGSTLRWRDGHATRASTLL